MGITHDDVQRIIQLLNETLFDELHLETNGLKLDVRRAGAVSLAVPAVDAEQSTQHAAQITSSPTVANPSINTQTQQSDNDRHVICAPMLGTFYRSPKPGEPPFIEVGSRVEPDTVIGIIEVMKLMNSISAGVSGKVVEILRSDGEFVEYGQVLARIRPAA